MEADWKRLHLRYWSSGVCRRLHWSHWNLAGPALPSIGALDPGTPVWSLYKALTTFVYFSAPGFSGWGCQSSLQNKPHPLLHTWLCLPSLNLASRSKSLLWFCRCLAGRSGPGKVLSAPLRAGSLSWRRYSRRSVDRSSSSRQPSWGQPRKQPSARHMSLFSSNDTVFALSSGHGKCGKGSSKS